MSIPDTIDEGWTLRNVTLTMSAGAARQNYRVSPGSHRIYRVARRTSSA